MYPPNHHIETDLEKSYRIIESFRFATLINRTRDDLVVTHVPLILDRKRGKLGTLIGHMDKNNPHVSNLIQNPVFVIFHGPNAYISPNVYASHQLPTWNSISVHIRGHLRLIERASFIRDSIIKMTEVLETGSSPYSLVSDDSRMSAWLNLIVGFEIEIEEIIGRFKLSQDKSEEDMLLARKYLSKSSRVSYGPLLDDLFS